MINNNVRFAGGWRRRARLSAAAGTLLAALLVSYLVVEEANSSRVQARHFAQTARELTFNVEVGPSTSIRFPGEGPFDERLGYSRLPGYLQRLGGQGFVVDSQARLSPALLNLAERGYFPPYREKTQAGLSIYDCRGEALFRMRHPQRVFASFDAIPPLIVRSLLFIENRELLDTAHPQRNPAIDWVRLGKAVMSQTFKLVDADYDVPGGSTLATQIEKYRHSPEGVTSSIGEKFRQMVSASLRAYLDGEDTRPMRRQIVMDYLNTVPLSAFPGYGEVNGLGDGLWTWYGADLASVSAALRDAASTSAGLQAQGRAYRQVLSLMIAHRRPTHFLGTGREHLAALTESYLRLFAGAGLISPALRDAALAANITFRDPQRDPVLPQTDAGDAAGVVRNRLALLLDEPLYRLDRLDLSVTSALDAAMQDAVNTALHRLRDRKHARAAGLIEKRLLGTADPAKVLYSFTLFERGEDANRVRVQTDNFDQPFDINEGSKLELGSTAKLRTLASYLEVVAALHAEYAGMDSDELKALPLHRRDNLARWAVEHLRQSKDRSLGAMLEAAMERRYSASPGEAFFTGGGLHTFANYRPEDDARRPSVREALRDSINLPFIRMMRDIVYHHMYHSPDSIARALEQAESPQRVDYLARFADREGRIFVQRFYRKYQGKQAGEMLETLLATVRPTAERLAVIFRALEPEAGLDAFKALASQHLDQSDLGEEALTRLYRKHAPGSFSPQDQGYIARLHPLELWLVGYLRRYPHSDLRQVQAAAAEQRQAVYAWLFKTRHKGAQDQRIHTLLEAEAFPKIHKQWKRLGYPFDFLVASYATALGSSGDRPGALAELMGIILNGGVRLPSVRLDRLHFAADTPYETRLARGARRGERVMAAETAAVLRRVLTEVVDAGTARRLAGAFVLPDGTKLDVGGKTGTGDNRHESYGSKGQVLRSQALSRTATFVFFLGERHFGTLTAFVPGKAADDYSFTSALPAQILKTLAPQLLPFLDRSSGQRCPVGPEPIFADRSAHPLHAAHGSNL